MTNQTFLTNHLLIATPQLEDPVFRRTVTYICEHTPKGAMGIVLNRPLNMQFGEILKQMNIQSDLEAVRLMPVISGGPMGAEQGFILHNTGFEFRSTFVTSGEIAITTSRDILEAIAEGKGPEKHLISLGFAGWSAGQLEKELVDNAWLTAPVNLDVVFEESFPKRWEAAAKTLGINILNFSGTIGHG